MIEHKATKIGLIGLGWQGFVIAQHLADCVFSLAVRETDTTTTLQFVCLA